MLLNRADSITSGTQASMEAFQTAFEEEGEKSKSSGTSFVNWWNFSTHNTLFLDTSGTQASVVEDSQGGVCRKRKAGGSVESKGKSKV